MIEEDGRRSRRSTRYRFITSHYFNSSYSYSCSCSSDSSFLLFFSGDFQLAEFSDLDSSSDEKVKINTTKNKSQGRGRTKECPGCGAMLSINN